MSKFLFVSANQGGGGSEELWIQSASILAHHGHQVLALTEWNETAKRRKTQLSTFGITHRALANNSLFPIKVARKLLRMREPGLDVLNYELKRFNPDIVIFNSGTLLDGLQYLEAINDNRSRCVVVTHLVSTDNWPNDLLSSRILTAFSQSEEACFVSEHNRNLFFLQTGERLTNSHIVRNPFLVSRALPMPAIKDGGPVKLALPARLHPRTKGHDILFEVLARPHWINRNLNISILGTGSCEMTLKKLCSNLGINHKVSFVGHVNDMESVWRDHHGLILPSRHEGLPIAQVEAMWSGRVVIASPAGGIPEIMKPGISGFLAKSCDAESLDYTLSEAWSRLNDWEAIGAAAGHFIRTIIPPNPAQIWAEHLLTLVETKPR